MLQAISEKNPVVVNVHSAWKIDNLFLKPFFLINETRLKALYFIHFLGFATLGDM